jgi:hypothetical protein
MRILPGKRLLSPETFNFISRILTRFGPLTAPITIRRGERISNNSGSDPERAPAASRHPLRRRSKPMRKQDVFPSTYYNARDLLSNGPVMLTIDYAAMESVGEGTNQQQKLVAHFKEPDSKLLVVTSTKYDAISLIARSDETEGWPGVKIVLERGKASFQGKLVDSINIKAPRRPAPQEAPAPPKAPAPVGAELDFDDEF